MKMLNATEGKRGLQNAIYFFNNRLLKIREEIGKPSIQQKRLTEIPALLVSHLKLSEERDSLS